MKTRNSTTAGAPRGAAFTLIELLIVISVIAILASLIFPVTRTVNKRKILARAGVELVELETAITAYQLKLGHYPPDNRGTPYQNQLYYELEGSKLDGSGMYQTLDGEARVAATTVPALFGTTGFVNSNKGATTDEGPVAQRFFRVAQGKSMSVLSTNGAGPFMAFGSLLKGPTMLPASDGSGKLLNPWRYISSGPTNNPSSFDLWIDVNVGTTVYRIGNWSKQPLVIVP